MTLHEANRPERHPQRGSAFLIVILLTLVVTALGATMLVMSNTDHMIAANERDSERALYASKAGLEYGMYLLRERLITPTEAGASFDSLDAAVKATLDGESFAGKIYDEGSSYHRGRVYRIEVTGTYNRASRTTELVAEEVAEAFRYGYLAFNDLDIKNTTGSTFRIDSGIYSRGELKLPIDVVVDGTIVSANKVVVETGATVKRDIFANKIENKGTIEGDVKTLCAVNALSSGAATWDLVDYIGDKWAWLGGASTPGTITNSGTILGSQQTYTIQNGDEFQYNVFRRDGRPLSDPDLNVIKSVVPPMLDYAAMKAEADKYDPTYFNSMTDAMTYLASKKVTETISGKTLTNIKVGTDTFPEFLYVRGDFKLELDPDRASDDLGGGKLKADGFHLEGGIYATGDVELKGKKFDPALYPSPPAWYQYKINALPYCLPAVIAYEEPSTGSIATWTPEDTPPVNSGSKLKMEADGTGAFAYITGVSYSQDETKLKHKKSSEELIRYIGAQLSSKITNEDYMWFTYDPTVRCTNFLVTPAEIAEVVSYREIR